MDLGGKTLFISGASRGIGLAIALRAARDGANIVIAAKTAAPHPHLKGTIYTAAEDIRAAGGQALPLVVDVRDESAIIAAMAQAAERFGGIDIVVNNASAIAPTPVEETEMKRWDLMMQVNARGSFQMAKTAIPYLRRAGNPHVLTLSPPLVMDPRWFAGHVAYTTSKYAMSMVTLGMAEEFRGEGIAFNSLWPRVGIATAAIEFAVGNADELGRCRSPRIMADAAHAILVRPSRECTGNFFIDDTLLYSTGVRDFTVYGVSPPAGWREGMFLPEDDAPPPGAR
ncbi:MAG: short-chain dehydrogenase [Bradyrhizobium sp.]|nr:short-chain dehydrogenase [Bradyrhizobium sp.]